MSEIQDPEIPVISIVELGVIRDVIEKEGKIIVQITPTYSGCPAMDLMEKEVIEKLELAPKNYLSILVNRARMEGFIVIDFANEYEAAARELGQWRAQGKIQSKETIINGIENFLPAFLRLFSGEKLGKLMLQVNE